MCLTLLVICAVPHANCWSRTTMSPWSHHVVVNVILRLSVTAVVWEEKLFKKCTVPLFYMLATKKLSLAPSPAWCSVSGGRSPRLASASVLPHVSPSPCLTPPPLAAGKSEAGDQSVGWGRRQSIMGWIREERPPWQKDGKEFVIHDHISTVYFKPDEFPSSVQS